MTQLNKVLLAALLAAGAAGIGGCNTMEGAGKDVERAGEKMQDATCSTADKKTDPDCR